MARTIAQRKLLEGQVSEAFYGGATAALLLRPIMRPTISAILESARAAACEACGGPLPPWDHGPAAANRPPWVNGDTCSEACWRRAEGKTWPREEDCPGCPAHRDGPHSFGCSVGGKRQIVFPC